MDVIKFYLKNLNKKSQGYRATWLPSTPLQIGDFGVLENNVFSVEGNLKDMGIEFTTRESENPSDIDFSSENGINITFKASGDPVLEGSALKEAEAGVNIKFNNDKSYVFKLKGFKDTIISNLGEIKTKILKQFKDGEWPKNRVIINKLLTANSATILISGEAGISVDLKATAEVGTENMDIANADLGFELAAGQKLSTEIIGQAGVTPLYRVVGIKKGLFGTSVGSKSSDAAASEGSQEEDFDLQEIEMETED